MEKEAWVTVPFDRCLLPSLYWLSVRECRGVTAEILRWIVVVDWVLTLSEGRFHVATARCNHAL